MFNWGKIVEEQIRDAEQNGAFDNLKGAGKPLRLNDDENPFEGDLKMAHHILRNANAAPFWVEMDRDIRAQHALCETILDRYRTAKTPAIQRKAEADFRAEAKFHNDMVLHFNCICPAQHTLAKPPIDIRKCLSSE